MMRRITTILSDWKQKNQILATILIALVSVVTLTTIAFLILNYFISPETLLGTSSRTATTTDPNGAKTTVEETLSSTTPRFEILKTALTIGAGISALGILALSYRKQKDLEDSHFVERFGAAAEQLGHTDPAVRLAGVYAMTTVANQYSNFDQRQQCIDVLCGYLRLPYNPQDQEPHQAKLKITNPPSPPQTTSTSETEFTYRQDDSEVRNTILRTISSHVHHDAKTSWSKHDFDLTGAYLEGGNFGRAQFSGNNTTFAGAHFSGETTSFFEAQFNGETTWFDRAQFSGKTTTFAGAHFNGKTTWFNRAQFNRGNVSFQSEFRSTKTDFSLADFTADVSFEGSTIGTGEIVTDWNANKGSQPANVRPTHWPPTAVSQNQS